MLYNQVMMIPTKEQAIRIAAELLCQWLNFAPLSNDELAAARITDLNDANSAVLRLNGAVFLIEYRPSGKVSAVASAIQQLEKANSLTGDVVKLLIVPFMPELGRKHCQEAGISWIDLSGNVDLTGPGIRIYIQGKANRFKQPGRPASVFAPKSSRVARILLYNRNSAFTQRELSVMTGLAEGYISRIVRGLEGQDLVERDKAGKVALKDPELLLDAWLETYDLAKHTLHRGHVPARSGSTLLQELSETLSHANIKHAATGLGAAWLYTRFAAFRTVSIFIDEPIDAGILSDLGFRESDTGPNAWLILPNDESVFWHSEKVKGIQCVHPIQAYLDLKGHPERAGEAMSQLRRLVLE